MRCSVVVGVTLRLLVINMSSSSPAINTCRLLPAMCHNLRYAGRTPPATALTTPACYSVNTGSQARYRLRIMISAYPTCIRRPPLGGSRRNIAMPFGTEKLEWCGYPMVKKNLKIRLFVLSQSTNVTDRHTDTAWRHRPRLCIASCGKNQLWALQQVVVGPWAFLWNLKCENNESQ